jgi:hypothetical protein
MLKSPSREIRENKIAAECFSHTRTSRSSFGEKSRYHSGNQHEAIRAATLVFHIAEVCRMATLVAYVSAVYMSDHAAELRA